MESIEVELHMFISVEMKVNVCCDDPLFYHEGKNSITH
jgi:hypothetical protein